MGGQALRLKAAGLEAEAANEKVRGRRLPPTSCPPRPPSGRGRDWSTPPGRPRLEVPSRQGCTPDLQPKEDGCTATFSKLGFSKPFSECSTLERWGLPLPKPQHQPLIPKPRHQPPSRPPAKSGPSILGKVSPTPVELPGRRRRRNPNIRLDCSLTTILS